MSSTEGSTNQVNWHNVDADWTAKQAVRLLITGNESLEALYEEIINAPHIKRLREELRKSADQFREEAQNPKTQQDGGDDDLVSVLKRQYAFVRENVEYFDREDLRRFRKARGTLLGALTQGKDITPYWEEVWSAAHNLRKWAREEDSEERKALFSVLGGIASLHAQRDIHTKTWLHFAGARLWLRLRAPGAELGEEAGFISELDSPDYLASQSLRRQEEQLGLILDAVKTYLKSPWMEMPWLTNTLLVCLLDTSLRALLAEARSHIPSGLASYYPYPWRWLVSLIQFLVFFAVCSAAAAFLFHSDRFLAGSAVVAFMVLWYTRKILVSRRRGVYLRNQKQLVMTIGVVRSEIASQLYDPQEIERQLNELASAGLSIPSVARTLLHIAATKQSASA